MKKANFTINELVVWYRLNTDTEISQDFLIYMVKNGIITPKVNSTYSLDELNDFLLEKENNSFALKDGKLKVKNNRKTLINMLYSVEEPTKQVKKYKITNLSGNKLKLIKLG